MNKKHKEEAWNKVKDEMKQLLSVFVGDKKFKDMSDLIYTFILIAEDEKQLIK